MVGYYVINILGLILFFGLIIYIADKNGKKQREEEQIKENLRKEIDRLNYASVREKDQWEDTITDLLQNLDDNARIYIRVHRDNIFALWLAKGGGYIVKQIKQGEENPLELSEFSTTEDFAYALHNGQAQIIGVSSKDLSINTE